MKSAKQRSTGWIELINQCKIKTFVEKEIYKYLYTLEADTIKHAEMKVKK